MFFKFGKSAKPAAVKPPKQFDASAKIERRPLFVVGTGRCGTHFLEAIMREDPSILALHTDRVNAEADSFLRYGLWYKLPIDLEPARDFRRRLILSAQEEGRSYFEANAYMAVAAAELHQWYGANLIQLVRRPQDVVNSHLVKGWYEENYPRGDAALLPGFPPEMIAWIEGFPAWRNMVWLVGVASGMLAAVLLALRLKPAGPLFLVSLLCMVVGLVVHDLGMADGLTKYKPHDLAIIAGLIVVQALLWRYSARAAKAGVLR